jgi:Tfp pilus assembly protein PilO
MNRGFFTKLNLHFIALGLVLAGVIFLGVRYALAWSAIRSEQSSTFTEEEIEYGQLRAQMARLNGLPQKVQAADQNAQKFYDARIAPNYSTMIAQLDGTAEKDHVRLTRSAYTPAPAIQGLTEVRIDAGLSGQYTDMMHFINDIERDRNHVFFLITGVTFTGQQGGLVNLRIRLTTFLRSDAADIPQTTTPEPAGQGAP